MPSLGFNVLGAERVFQAAGCFPLLVGKQSASEAVFYSQLLAYLESGFPLFVAMSSRQHAVVVVGYSWRKSAAEPAGSSSHVWEQVEALLTVDDNLLPYGSVLLDSREREAGSPSYTAAAFDAFIVALPDKVYYPADAVDRLSQSLAALLLQRWEGNEEAVKFRRYFITTVSELRKHIRRNQSNMGHVLVGLMMCLDTAQFVWVVEYCGVDQWKEGRVAARAIVDATASPRDPVPLWLLHDENMAFVFDRSSGEGECVSIPLERERLGPLPRIELNLRPVVAQQTAASVGTGDPGGAQ